MFIEYGSLADEYENNLILEQYRGTMTLAQIVREIGEIASDLHDINREMYDLLDIDSMGGVNLDVIGRIVGCSRHVGEAILPDEVYAERIRDTIAASFCGTNHDIVSEIMRVHGATSVHIFVEKRNFIWAIIAAPVPPSQAEIEQMAPAGVTCVRGKNLATISGNTFTLVNQAKTITVAG